MDHAFENAIYGLPTLVFELEADFYGHLEFSHLTILNESALVDNFEPAQIAQGLGSPLDAVLDRFGKARGRCADDFGDFVGA